MIKNSFRGVLCLLILGVAPGAFAEPPNPSSATDSPSGKELCKKDFDSYKERLTKNPDDDKTWTQFRICVAELKRWHDGQEVATAGIQQRPQQPEAHLILGIALLHGKEYQKAADEFQTASQIKADQPQPYYYLGMADLFLNHPGEAAQAAEKAVELDPNNATYHSQVAYAAFLMEDNDKCEVSAKKAIELDPNNVAAYKVLGNLYEREGRQAESDKAFEAAMHANGRTAAASPVAASSLPGMAVPVSGTPQGTPTVTRAGAVMPSAEPSTPEFGDATEICRSQWENMKQAVAKGNMEKALTYFSDYADTRDLYRQSFEKLGITRVQGMLASLGEVEDCIVVLAAANCKAPIALQPGTMADATIRFERNSDGVWRIRSF